MLKWFAHILRRKRNYMAEEQQRDNQVRVNVLSEEEARRRKLLTLREKGIDPYPNRVLIPPCIRSLQLHNRAE